MRTFDVLAVSTDGVFNGLPPGFTGARVGVGDGDGGYETFTEAIVWIAKTAPGVRKCDNQEPQSARFVPHVQSLKLIVKTFLKSEK